MGERSSVHTETGSSVHKETGSFAHTETRSLAHTHTHRDTSGNHIENMHFPCYLQHFGAGNCHFHGICNSFELEPFIFHGICNILVVEIIFGLGFIAGECYVKCRVCLIFKGLVKFCGLSRLCLELV